MVKDAVGGTEADVLNFARHDLFGPLGMQSVVFETDSTGTPVGSTNMLASARDWARLGLLYLNDGVVGGARVFPAGWVAYSRRSTLGTSYGAGLWTNDGPSEDARDRIAAGMPADGFYASGRLGQRVYIMPSQQLVIVRLGITQQPGFGMGGDLRLIREVIAATTAPHTPQIPLPAPPQGCCAAPPPDRTNPPCSHPTKPARSMSACPIARPPPGLPGSWRTLHGRVT